MKAGIKKLSGTKITIEADVAEVDHAFEEALKVVSKQANIKGFRKGKIPKNVLQTYYPGEILREAVNHLVNHTYPKALDEHKLSPVLEPHFHIEKPMEEGKKFEYEVEVEIKPEFDLKDYKGIKLKKRKTEINPKDIEQELSRIQEAKAELKPANKESVLQDGLVATIDFFGTIDGKPFEGSEAKSYLFEYGKGHFLKDFEAHIKGAKEGEEKTFDLTFPSDYFAEALKGKIAAFKVKVVALHEKLLPKLDDELAKDLGKESLEAIKTEVTTFLTKRKEREIRQEYAKDVMDLLGKEYKFDVPEGLIDAEVKAGKKDKNEVEKNLRLQFVLQEISVKEKDNIKIDPKDVEERFHSLSHMYRQPVDVIKKYYTENKMLPQLVSQILLEKTLDFVIDNATLKE